MAIYLRSKSYYYDFVHKRQRYTGCIGKVSRTTAKEEEHRKMTEVIEQRLNPAKARKSPRFDAFAEKYLEWLKTNRSPHTYERVVGVMKHLVPFFGAKQVNDLTPWHFEQYKKARREAQAKSSTLNTELSFLKAMLYKAHKWGNGPADIGKGVKLVKNIRGKERFLSEEEEAALLSVCSPEPRRVVETGLLTGFRRQELISLRPEDMDFARGTLTVAAAYSKNGESRTFPLTDRLRAIIEEALAARGNIPTVFRTEAGEPWTRYGLSQAFARACRRAGLERLGPHVMRHTFASRLVMTGVDLRTVQELLGHKSITMTMRYSHLSPSHTRRALEVLEQRFSGKSPSNFHNTPISAGSPAGRKVLKIR